MYKLKKENTPEEVYRRIEKLIDTLEIVKLELEDRSQKIDIQAIRMDIVNFLLNYNVNIELRKTEYKSLEETLSENKQSALDLSERTYRFSGKIFKKNYQETNPTPIFYSTMSLLTSIKKSGDVINLMDILSNAITYDKNKILPKFMIKTFKNISEEYKEAFNKIEKSTFSKIVLKEKKEVMKNTYKEGLKEYFTTLSEIVNTTTKEQKGKIVQANINLMQKFHNHNSNNKPKTVKTYTISSTDVNKLAKSGNVQLFEKDNGEIIGLDYKKTKTVLRRDIILYTRNKENINKITVTFPKNTHRHINKFFIALSEKASKRDFGGIQDYMNKTNKTAKYLKRGFLTGR